MTTSPGPEQFQSMLVCPDYPAKPATSMLSREDSLWLRAHRCSTLVRTTMYFGASHLRQTDRENAALVLPTRG